MMRAAYALLHAPKWRNAPVGTGSPARVRLRPERDCFGLRRGGVHLLPLPGIFQEKGEGFQ